MLSSMKKIHSHSLEKILIACGFALTVTVLGFWHYQQILGSNQQLTSLSEGINTCFYRVNQSFTAVMVKDLQSPYLQRDFMKLSDQCFQDVRNLSKKAQALASKTSKSIADMTSEVFWFHEKTLKVIAPFLVDPNKDYQVQSVSDKFEKMETLKFDLVDSIESLQNDHFALINRDKNLIYGGFAGVLICIAWLSTVMIGALRRRHKIEHHALTLLNIGNAQVSPMVEDLVMNALSVQDFNITKQVFKDYHQVLLNQFQVPTTVSEATTEVPVQASKIETLAAPVSIQPTMAQVWSGRSVTEIFSKWREENKSSLIEESVEESRIQIDQEFMDQLLTNITGYFAEKEAKNFSFKGKMIDSRYAVSFMLPHVLINTTDLNYLSSQALQGTNVSLNLVLVKELCLENSVDLQMRNILNEHGKLVGAEMVLTFNLQTQTVEEQKPSRSLLRMFRGKKSQWNERSLD
jgi:hypothetical protein